MSLYLSRCSAVITITSLLFLLLVSWGQGELMARGMDFRKPRLVFMPVSARSFALFTQQDIGQLRKGLELYYK